jgi:hypothetical protein
MDAFGSMVALTTPDAVESHGFSKKFADQSR